MNTPITPRLLREKGFEERMMFGQVVYVKANCALVYSYAWIPCNLDSGTPLSTLVFVNTWEELEKLMKEGGIK